MAIFQTVDWLCRPVGDGIWARSVDSALGAYTPCAIDTLVVGTSHLLLLGLCSYRLWLITKSTKVRRYRLRTHLYNYLLGLLAAFIVGENLFKLAMGISISNLDGQAGFAPFEAICVIVEALVWCCMLTLLIVETKAYVREFRWYVRFGIIYVLVGEAVLVNTVLLLKEYYNQSVLYLYFSEIAFQVVFGILMLVYIPDLDPYPGYLPIGVEVAIEKTDYQTLPGGEQLCPERHASILSKIFFGWMTPLMQRGYRSPITETVVWKLDPWDQTETLINRFQKCWVEEAQRPKPWLLKALNQSLGGRYSVAFKGFGWEVFLR